MSNAPPAPHANSKMTAGAIARSAANFAVSSQIRSGGALGGDTFRIASSLVRGSARLSNVQVLEDLIRRRALIAARRQARLAEGAPSNARRIGVQGGIVRRVGGRAVAAGATTLLRSIIDRT